MTILQTIYITSVIVTAFVYILGTYALYRQGKDISLLHSLAASIIPFIPVVNTIITLVFTGYFFYLLLQVLNNVTVFKGKK